MIPEETIRKAAELLRRAAEPVRIILFGSYARGDATEDSDLDFVVVERSVKDRRGEMVRLRDILSPLRVPADIIVISEDAWREWRDLPGTALYEAALEGRVLYEAG